MFVIEVLSAVGGAGKTTLSLALASFWASQGADVCVYDADESLQLSDAPPPKTFDVAGEMPTGGYDIVIIDTRPGTDRPNHGPDVILYPMLPHAKSIRGLERARKMLKTDKVVFVINRCDFRKPLHSENAKIIRATHQGVEVRERATIEKILEHGGDFMEWKRDSAWYKARNFISAVATRIESYM